MLYTYKYKLIYVNYNADGRTDKTGKSKSINTFQLFWSVKNAFGQYSSFGIGVYEKTQLFEKSLKIVSFESIMCLKNSFLYNSSNEIMSILCSYI